MESIQTTSPLSRRRVTVASRGTATGIVTVAQAVATRARLVLSWPRWNGTRSPDGRLRAARGRWWPHSSDAAWAACADGPKAPTFRPAVIGHDPAMQTPVGIAVAGMRVVDSTGAPVGTVSAVQPAGTDVRPDVVAGIAEHLMVTGYLRIDGTGVLSNDVYAAGNQVGAVTDGEHGVVELLVHREGLHRAAP
jgi:hypothetical protein